MDLSAAAILSDEMRAEIDRVWLRAKTHLEQKGIPCFNGPLYKLVSYRRIDSCLELTLGRTDYKEYVGTNVTHPEWRERFGDRVMSNPLAMSVALKTLDGLIVLGNKTSIQDDQPRIHVVPSGHFTPTDCGGNIDYSCPSVWAQVLQESKDELGDLELDKDGFVVTGLIRNLENFKPELTFRVTALAKWKQIQKEALRAPDKWEYSDLFSVEADPQCLQVFLREKNRRFVPPGHAALLLYGHLEFGRDWFRQTISSLTDIIVRTQS
jgi:hypothetical protein